MKPIKYICGYCLNTDDSDKNGNCAVCEKDVWVEARDFEFEPEWIELHLSRFQNLIDLCKDLEYTALDWDGGEYVDVRKDIFDKIQKLIQD